MLFLKADPEVMESVRIIMIRLRLLAFYSGLLSKLFERKQDCCKDSPRNTMS